jgi:hypothetical protein
MVWGQKNQPVAEGGLGADDSAGRQGDKRHE